jgi:hypothetical protein
MLWILVVVVAKRHYVVVPWHESYHRILVFQLIVRTTMIVVLLATFNALNFGSGSSKKTLCCGTMTWELPSYPCLPTNRANYISKTQLLSIAERSCELLRQSRRWTEGRVNHRFALLTMGFKLKLIMMLIKAVITIQNWSQQSVIPWVLALNKATCFEKFKF